MSDAGKVKLYSLEETTLGTTPAAAMNTVAAANSISDGIQVTAVQSNVLRSDYVKPDTIRTQEAGAKSVPFEAQYGDVPLTDWIEGVLRSDRTSALSVTGTDISFTAPNTISSTSSDLSIYPVGTVIRVAGSTSNDIFDIVVARTSTSITTLLGQVVTETAGDSVTIDNDGQVKNGSTLKSYTLEEHFTDLSSLPFWANPGLRASGMTLDIPTGGLVTGTATFGGMEPSVFAAATAGTGSANAATTTKTFSGAAHIFGVFEGGSAVTAKISRLSLNLSAPVRNQYELGALGPWGVGGNSFAFSGSMDVYNNDAGATLWNKLKNDTATSLYYRLTRDGASYFFSMPNIRLTGGNPDVGNVDSDVMLPLAFNIDYSSTYGFLFALDRFAAS